MCFTNTHRGDTCFLQHSCCGKDCYVLNVHFIYSSLMFLNISGEKIERQVLIERNRQLRAENTRLNMIAAQLSQRMEVGVVLN